MTDSSIESRFGRSLAVVIGIDKYESGIPPLNTAANDARRLATMLADQHDFEVRLFLDEDASHERILGLLTEQLPQELGSDDRLILYFAGHGVALDGDDGPNGYLLPQDARRGEEDSYLFMPLIHDALLALPVRHALIIMDSCFSGAFRWAATRSIVWMPDVVHEERFDRFVKDPAWQVITSTAHDQEAMDQLSSGSLGTRPDEDGHSPFALALFEALDGKGDVVPADGGDGLITATELYLYLESRLQPETMEEGSRQTPGLWPLSRHDKGEFVFAAPGQDLNLPPAPPLNLDNNPYRGLESYEREHADLFFGRENVISDLEKRVETEALTVVLGASGTGKSSVVKAGLMPRLERRDGWVVLPTVRPGAHPLQSLGRALGRAPTESAVEAEIESLCEANPKTVLFIDQFEELVTMTSSPEERVAVLELLCCLLKRHSEKLDIVVTLRTDFEPQFRRGELKEFWESGRCVIPPMTQDELRECILSPASARVMYFNPHELVDELINEVVATPGGLPLLSFALSEMYIHYLGRGSDDRAIEREDFDAVGGVVGALRSRANAEYKALDKDHQQTMRMLMLRMVASGSGNVARRRVLRSELEFGSDERNEQVRTIIDRLIGARLLVMGNESPDGDGEDYVEPAHDALVRAWGRLLAWVHEENEQDPDDLRFQRKLSADAEAWEHTEDKSLRRGLLWSDAARSTSLRAILYSGVSWLNRRERKFADLSVQARHRIYVRWAGVAGVVVVLAVGALLFAAFALQQRDRAIAQGLAANVQSELSQGNLFRAVQIARRADEEYSNEEPTHEAALSIAAHEDAQLLRFQTPGRAEVKFGPDERWFIAATSFDNNPRDVAVFDLSGNRTLIEKNGQDIRVSSGGRWLTVELQGVDTSLEPTDHDTSCRTQTWSTTFDLGDLGGDDKPTAYWIGHVPPYVGVDDTAYVFACGSAIFAENMPAAPPENTTDLTGGFNTVANVDQVFFDEHGRIVAVSKNLIFDDFGDWVSDEPDITRVYSRSGELLLELDGSSPTVAGERIATAVGDYSSGHEIHVYDHEGRRTHTFEGSSPVLSPHGRRLAFADPDTGNTAIVDLDLEEASVTETYTLRNGRELAVTMSRRRFVVDGITPVFSPDGSLVMTSWEIERRSEISDARTGELLFSLEGNRGEFARHSPSVMTVANNTEIRLWDLRRLKSAIPLTWNGLRPEVDLETYVAMHHDGDGTRCLLDAGSYEDACWSPDGKTEASAEVYGVSPFQSEYFVFREDPLNIVDSIQFEPELVSDVECGRPMSITYSLTEPWVLLACDNGIELKDLNGRLLQTWDANGEGAGAFFDDDGRTVYDVRSDYSVWVHAPGEPQSASIRLTDHDSTVIAADSHSSGLVATAAESGTITVFDPQQDDIRTMRIQDGRIDKVLLSSDGSTLFARTWEPRIYRWNLSGDIALEMYDWVDPISDEDWAALTE